MLESLICNIWWFLAGLLVGLILCAALRRCCKKDNQSGSTPTPSASTSGAQKTAATKSQSSKNVSPPKSTSNTSSGNVLNSAARSSKKSTAPAKPAATNWDKSAANSAGIKTKGPTDLKVIEGIGPKTETLLKEHGIQNWTDLAATPVARLREIISSVEWAVLRLPSTASWPEQSGLARDGDWTRLRKLQDQLKDGVYTTSQGAS